jgi:hypothetical protein
MMPQWEEAVMQKSESSRPETKKSEIEIQLSIAQGRVNDLQATLGSLRKRLMAVTSPEKTCDSAGPSNECNPPRPVMSPMADALYLLHENLSGIVRQIADLESRIEL